MSNNFLTNQTESPSDRGGYLIPPLPQTKLVSENDSKARSPLGRSWRNKAGFVFAKQICQENSLRFDETGYNEGEDHDRSRDILEPLPLPPNGKCLAECKTTIEKENAVPVLPASFLSKSSCSRAVLRPRETMEILFGLTRRSSEEYRQLCHQVADGTMSDDAAAWRRVLELAALQEDVNKISLAASNKQRGCLLRLHRRAVTKVPLPNQKHTSDSFNVLQVWLAYSRVLANLGSMEDCRVVFRKIRDNGLGEREASFYLAFADFEKRNGSIQDAQDILQLGIEKNAQPMQSLKTSLNELAQSSGTLVSQVRVQHRRRAPRNQGIVCTTMNRVSHRVLPLSLSTRKCHVGAGISPKRRMAEMEEVEVKQQRREVERACQNNLSVEVYDVSMYLKSEARSSSTQENSKQKTDNIPQLRHPASIPTLSKSRTRDEGKLIHISHGSPNAEGGNAIWSKLDPSPLWTSDDCPKVEHKTKHAVYPDQSHNDQPSATKITSRVGAVGREGGKSLKKHFLFSKTPRLTRMGLSGTAQRVDTAHSTAVRSDCVDIIAFAENETVTRTRITHKDLRYIIDWKPTLPNNPGTTSEMKTRHDKKTEDKSWTSTVPDQLKQGGSSVSSNRKSVQSTITLQSNSAESSISESTSRSTTRSSAESSPPVSPTTVKLVADPNPDFLPLVSEKNIIRVNNVPYVKLGVVGKGGSSKVYRALTKDLNVLAIKRVKLSGMDQKSVEGYANEIALLKRLRNNPAIIQMHDSEVDPVRKAIYVVMEAGETDLNHVLQQRTRPTANGSWSTKSRALDMNFMRLTWQQMLTAVHCIHEARIIHGDLKPANFLFVKGHLKLIDFGIAKAIQSEDTTNIYRESHVGTLNYMSPEAILDSGTGKTGAQRMKCGRASDIWSLGCILYQMAYGQTPFAELQMIQKLRAIIDPYHKISFPETVNNAAVDAMKLCLRRKPQDRPPIVGENGLLNEHVFLNEYPRNPKPWHPAS